MITPEVLIEHVNQSIQKAIRHESWIDKEILDIKGFTTGVVRRLFSNITHLPKADGCYVEAGLFCGASFCAAMNNNPTLNCYGIENLSQPFDVSDVADQLAANVARFRGGARSVEVFDCDVFQLDLKKIKQPIDVVFYDAVHSFEAQRDAIPHFFEALADTAIILTDDAHWVPVREGVKEGLKMLEGKLKVEREWMLSGEQAQDDPVFHNGLVIHVVSKIK